MFVACSEDQNKPRVFLQQKFKEEYATDIRSATQVELEVGERARCVRNNMEIPGRRAGEMSSFAGTNNFKLDATALRQLHNLVEGCGYIHVNYRPGAAAPRMDVGRYSMEAVNGEEESGEEDSEIFGNRRYE